MLLKRLSVRRQLLKFLALVIVMKLLVVLSVAMVWFVFIITVRLNTQQQEVVLERRKEGDDTNKATEQPSSDETNVKTELALVNPVTKRCWPHPGRITTAFGGGLGNYMFQFASIYGIARRLGMTPVVPTVNELTPIFEMEGVDTTDEFFEKKAISKFGLAFDSKMLDTNCSEDTVVCCYLQSWKYFQGYEDEIRSKFRFRENVEKSAQFLWDSLILPAAGNATNDVIFVAVHVRRGDKASNPKSIRFGNTVANADYVLRGYRFFQEKFSVIPVNRSRTDSQREISNNINNYHTSNFINSDQERYQSLRNKKVIFVVASDDLKWARRNLPASVSVFVDSGSREVDMAVLSRCDHTLMTVGTFGWWIAWLVNGTTVYYRKLFVPGSQLAFYFNNTGADWPMPGWIAME